jgi:hypothetical protein
MANDLDAAEDALAFEAATQQLRPTTKLIYEIWVEDAPVVQLPSLCLAGPVGTPPGERFRRKPGWFTPSGAGSNHEAMTIYCAYHGSREYKLDHAADRQPDPEACGERQRRAT